MTNLTILGTDTDAGKTTFALLWLAAFPGDWHYWKPLETGESDSEKVCHLIPETVVHAPIAQFDEAVAPPLAARRVGRMIPSTAGIVEQMPKVSPLLIETFGSPFSPLNDDELQLSLITQLGFPTVLVSSSKIGAIGRTLSLLQALKIHEIEPSAVVLLGDEDPYAVEQIEKHGAARVFHLTPPRTWSREDIAGASLQQRVVLTALHDSISSPDVEQYSVDASSKRWLEADVASVWHPYTSLRAVDAPLLVVGADAEFLHLADGRRIIDGISSWWTILHGHREPRLMAALRQASQCFDHVLFAGVTHPPAIRVAELLLETMPWSGGRTFFSDNGSTAVEVALKMAYQYWCQRGEKQRTLFIGFENGYHGDTFGAMAVGRDPLFFGRFEPLLFQAKRVPLSAESLDDVLSQHHSKVAAVIIEPLVQGAGGMVMHSPEELRAIFDVTRKHNVLFIADEVMTGLYRTGTMWAFEAAGIAPDLVCTAKTLAGGILSLAATLVSPHVVSMFDTADSAQTFFHGHSFTAHPLACAIAVANLEWLKRERPTAPARFERFWRETLSPLNERPNVRDVRIRGTIAAIEVAGEGGYLAEVSRAMRHCCLELGVFLRPLGNVLYAMPPFGTSEESMSRIAEAMKKAVSL